MNIIYHANFVDDKAALMQAFPPVHMLHYYDHETIEFRPKSRDRIRVGLKSDLMAYGRLITAKVDALLVLCPLSVNRYPHITLSTAEGVSPKDVNDEIMAHRKEVEYIPLTKIPVTEGVQTTTGKYLSYNQTVQSR